MVKNPIVTTDAPQRDQKLGATFDQVFTRVTLAEINNKIFSGVVIFFPKGLLFPAQKRRISQPKGSDVHLVPLHFPQLLSTSSQKKASNRVAVAENFGGKYQTG